MIAKIKLTNTMITGFHFVCAYDSQCVCVCGCEMKILKVYALSYFEIHNTVLTIVFMLYIRFSEIVHSITEDWYPLTTLFSYHQHPVR